MVKPLQRAGPSPTLHGHGDNVHPTMPRCAGQPHYSARSNPPVLAADLRSSSCGGAVCPAGRDPVQPRRAHASCRQFSRAATLVGAPEAVDEQAALDEAVRDLVQQADVSVGLGCGRGRQVRTTEAADAAAHLVAARRAQGLAQAHAHARRSACAARLMHDARVDSSKCERRTCSNSAHSAGSNGAVEELIATRCSSESLSQWWRRTSSSVRQPRLTHCSPWPGRRRRPAGRA